MRIIAGKYRRRVLHSNPGNTTRPILDRAKVILFDRIRDWLPNAKVADLFCGTGTLGLECLSRGAERVVFAERDHRAYELLRQNVAMLGAERESLCWRVDLARCSFQPKGDIAWTPYNVIFFDPPYKAAETIAPGDTWYRALQRLARPQLSALGALLIVRTPRESDPVLPSTWHRREELEIASMRIVVAEKPEHPTTELDSDLVAESATELHTDSEEGLS